MTALLRYAKSTSIGVAVALLIGSIAVAMSNTVWALAKDFPIFTLWDSASVSQIVIASTPFIVLAIFGIRTRRPWIVGICLTAAFWGFYVYEITRPYEGGGADIGLGILMLFSPLPIAGASLLSLVTLVDGRSGDEIANGS